MFFAASRSSREYSTETARRSNVLRSIGEWWAFEKVRNGRCVTVVQESIHVSSESMAIMRNYSGVDLSLEYIQQNWVVVVIGGSCLTWPFLMFDSGNGYAIRITHLRMEYFSGKKISFHMILIGIKIYRTAVSNSRKGVEKMYALVCCECWNRSFYYGRRRHHLMEFFERFPGLWGRCRRLIDIRTEFSCLEQSGRNSRKLERIVDACDANGSQTHNAFP